MIEGSFKIMKHTVHVIFDDGLSRHFPTDDGSTACSTLKVFNDF